MNDIFNIKRFGKYLGADLVSAGSKYGITLLVASLSGVILYLFFLILRIFHIVQAGIYSPGTAETMFAFAGIFLVCGMPSALYGHITDKRSGSSYLMLPASTLEKFLSMVLICLIIVPLIFSAIFIASDALIALIDKHYPGADLNMFNKAKVVSDISEISFFWGFSIVIYITEFLLGALFFNKHKIVNTILVLFAIGLVMMLIFGMATASFFSNADISAFENFTYKMVDILENCTWIITLWHIIFLAALLAVVYFRVRKIQH